jgi:hypothetical protein
MVGMEHPIAKGKPLTRFWGYDKREGVHAGPRVAVAKFKPSTDWSWGGPIIEREKLCVTANMSGSWIGTANNASSKPGLEVVGPTPLIAAMRAYVANKYGKEVPDE